MLRLYHSPQTRSTRILWLIEELGVRDQVDLAPVHIARQTGGTSDPANPHPEGKVPVLDHDGTLIMESAAITLYLTDMFPDAGLGRSVGDAGRGAYLTWLHYYGGVMEPVLTMQFSTLTPDQMFVSNFRGFDEMAARLSSALTRGPYLMGDAFSAADLLIVAPFIWFPAMAPDTPQVQDWITRCAARPLFAKVGQEDARMMAD